MDSEPDEWWSVTNLATASGYTTAHIRDLIRRGKIVGRKIVTVWQVNCASWNAYLADQRASGNKRGPRKITG